MAISYSEARDVVTALGAAHAGYFKQEQSNQEILPLQKAAGRIANNDVYSPISTPIFDSSAMDGFAVISKQTSLASAGRPLRMRVAGLIAAGDQPAKLGGNGGDLDDELVCVEIMTGAPFPLSSPDQVSFDACIPVEQVEIVPDARMGRAILIRQAVAPGTHRRIAGSDFRKGDVVLRAGSTIGAHHLMALASVGVCEVSVTRRPRLAVISTGAELAAGCALSRKDQQHKIPDTNSIYLRTALQEIGADVDCLGPLPDDAGVLKGNISQAIRDERYDVVVTSGGVSAGRFDLIPGVVRDCGGDVRFHHVRMRPGHPVLVATFGANRREAAFFGLPGNPIAAAACLRFLLIPYLRCLIGVSHSGGMLAAVTGPTTPKDRSCQDADTVLLAATQHHDIFRHAHYRCREGQMIVEISTERSPAKMSPFSKSNCWVRLPAGSKSVRSNDLIEVYPFYSAGR